MSEQANNNNPQWHIYYQLRFALETALLIGSGESVHTDHDLLVNAVGLPCIPGSTVAGMLRAMLSTKEAKKALFGDMDDGQLSPSPLYVYDAVFQGKKEDRIIAKRDNVALDEYKTALDKKKFDYQVLEPPAEFVGLIEINKDVPDDVKDQAEALMKRLAAQGCAFGSKKSRGMGRMTVTVRKKDFDLAVDEQKTAWLDFDPFEDSFTKGDSITGAADVAGDVRITLKLNLKGGLSIREYTTDVDGADYRTLAYAQRQNTALVTGTSWAGAFRGRVREFAGEQAAQMLFGYVLEPAHQQSGQAEAETPSGTKQKKKTKARKSLIAFSETEITGGTKKIITRNAIDRFSGKTKDGALYTEQTYYGGSGDLIITLRQPGDKLMEASWEALGISKAEAETLLRQAKAALGAAIADLHHGLLAVGGLTAVGRGLFEISAITVNGVPFPMGENWENELIRKLTDGTQREEANRDDTEAVH